MARNAKYMVGGAAALASLLVLTACGGSDSAGSAGDDSGESIASGDLTGRTLTITSWGGGWTDSTKEFFADPFMEETGAKVEFAINGLDPIAPVLLQAQQGNVSIDVIDGVGLGKLQVRDLLEPFPDELVAIFEETSRPDTVGEHVWGYGDTATVIVCNPTIVEKCPTTAAEFWDVENFPGDRGIDATYYIAMFLASLADGVEGEDLLPVDVDRAIAKLEEIKPHIKVWPDSGSTQEQTLIDKEIGIGYYWHTRVAAVKRDHIPELEVYWEDAVQSDGIGFAVPKGAPNADVAFAFLKWIAEHPEQQAKWTEAQGASTPTNQLLDLLSPELADSLPAAHNPVRYSEFKLAEQDAELTAPWQEFITG